MKEIFKNLEPISLSEMDGIAFNGRLDDKYIGIAPDFNEMELMINGNFKVLEIENYRQFDYETLYFDTADLKFFYDHLRGIPNRKKIRYRHYIQSDTIFLEIKQKIDDYQTVKWRKRIEPKALIEKTISTGLEGHESVLDLKLLPVLEVGYKRITLVNIHSNTRITIDQEINFIYRDNCYSLKDLAILEIKHMPGSIHAFSELELRKLGFIKSSFSKYCMGISKFYNVKDNNLKPIWRSIKKLNEKLHGNHQHICSL